MSDGKGQSSGCGLLIAGFALVWFWSKLDGCNGSSDVTRAPSKPEYSAADYLDKAQSATEPLETEVSLGKFARGPALFDLYQKLPRYKDPVARDVIIARREDLGGFLANVQITAKKGRHSEEHFAQMLVKRSSSGVGGWKLVRAEWEGQDGSGYKTFNWK